MAEQLKKKLIRRSVLLAVLAFAIALPSLAHTHTPAIDLVAPIDRYEVDDRYSVAPELVVIDRATRRAFERVSTIELPADPLSDQLAKRLTAVTHVDDRQALSVFAVKEKLASGVFGWRDESNINGASDLAEEWRRATEYQALPFSEPATGLIFVRARWYDPSTGTFLTPDPMGYQDSSNLYAFAGGDPVNGRDPTGRQMRQDITADERMHIQCSSGVRSFKSKECVKALGTTPAQLRALEELEQAIEKESQREMVIPVNILYFPDAERGSYYDDRSLRDFIEKKELPAAQAYYGRAAIRFDIRVFAIDGHTLRRAASVDIEDVPTDSVVVTNDGDVPLRKFIKMTKGKELTIAIGPFAGNNELHGTTDGPLGTATLTQHVQGDTMAHEMMHQLGRSVDVDPSSGLWRKAWIATWVASDMHSHINPQIRALRRGEGWTQENRAVVRSFARRIECPDGKCTNRLYTPPGPDR